ncbi:hypothetical protein MMPV_006410 [Pyropia vietnamensis]
MDADAIHVAASPGVAAGGALSPGPDGAANAPTSSAAVSRGGADAEAPPPADAERARCYHLRQQELWSVRPVWSAKFVIILYTLVGVAFLPIGIAILLANRKMTETPQFRYDNLNQCDVGALNADGTTRTCTVRLQLDRDVKAPAYFYYGLVNFFQNQRNYIKSRSAEQLRGDFEPGTTDISECDPKTEGPDGETLLPCGLTAFSRFNDSFLLCRDDACNDEVQTTKDGIAWDVDVNKRFKAGPAANGYTEDVNNLITDPDFIVWMRLAAYGTFRKLFWVITEDLEAGIDYFVRINASFPVESFNGEKFFVIAETRWFGGKNNFLAYAYLVVGGLALVLAAAFLAKYLRTAKGTADDEDVGDALLGEPAADVDGVGQDGVRGDEALAGST